LHKRNIVAGGAIFGHSAQVTAQLFLCDIRPGDDHHLPRLLARLDEQERIRAARFRFERDRLSFASAHALLRHALDRVAGAPQPWRFEVGEFGKPRLDPPLDDIRFNLSHASELVAVAVTRGCDLGVDVEDALRDPDEATFSNLVLAPEELAELDGRADRSERLFRIWVAKEAIVKAIGLGLSLPVKQIMLHGDIPRLIAIPEIYGPSGIWSLHTERHGTHWVALAARGVLGPVERVALTVEQLVDANQALW
jgi:4'-phosphopantetheinyl transferase